MRASHGAGAPRAGEGPWLGRSLVETRRGEVGEPKSPFCGDRERESSQMRVWSTVLRSAASKNWLSRSWDPRKTSPLPRGGLSRCLRAGDPPGELDLLASMSPETEIEQFLLGSLPEQYWDEEVLVPRP